MARRRGFPASSLQAFGGDERTGQRRVGGGEGLGVGDHLRGARVEVVAVECQVAGLHGEDLGVRVDGVEIHPVAGEERRCGDVQVGVQPASVGFDELDRDAPFDAGFGCEVGVDGHVEGGHGRVVERGDNSVDPGLQVGEVGRLGHERRLARFLAGLADQQLAVGQVAGVGGVFGGGGGDDDGDGDPEGEADRGEGGPGAGLVTAEVAQRQPPGDRQPGGAAGQQPDRQRADEQHPDDDGQRPGGDEQGVVQVQAGVAGGVDDVAGEGQDRRRRRR